MDVLGYSTCRMEFTPNDKRNEKREYSDRSTIELRVDDTAGYFLRAIDVENSNAEIFHIPLRGRDQYEFVMSDDDPDVLRDSKGTYRIWLKGESSKWFYDIFHNLLEALFPTEQLPYMNSEVSFSDEERLPTSITLYEASMDGDWMEMPKPTIPNPINCEARDVLINVRNLSQFIKQGNGNKAAQLVTQFVAQGIRLQTKPSERIQDESEFQILVQIDGNEYAIDQNGGTVPVEVFPSTTVRELRAAFEVTYNYSPTSQYFFVNGDLVQDGSTMRELHVGPNSLFVLFLIAHPKKFKDNGPWQCSSCMSTNQPTYYKCLTCLASRLD